MTHIYAALGFAFLAAIGCGVWRIWKDTSFIAGFIIRNTADAGEGDDEDEDRPPQVNQPQEVDEGTRPVGFGVRLRERN